MLMLLPALLLSAQSFNHDWKLHPNFSSSNIGGIVDTQAKVYYLVSGTLYCYDKQSGTNLSITTADGLHDITPTALFQDFTTGTVAVVYNTGNIDLLRPNGEIANFSGIKDLVLTSSATKKINSINFAGGKAYVACSFGYVVFDTTTMGDVQSHIMYINLKSVNIVGSRILISYNNRIYYGSADKEYDAVGLMSYRTVSAVGEIKPVSDTVFLLATSTSVLVCEFTVGSTGSVSITPTTLVSDVTVNNIQNTPDGFLVNCKSNSCYYLIDSEATTATKVSGGSQLFSQAPDGDGTIWAIGATGVHPSTESTGELPNAVGITDHAMHLAYNPFDGRMYVSRGAINGWIYDTLGGTVEVYAYDGVSWANVTPTKSGGTKIQTQGGCYRMAFVPGKNEYYMAGWGAYGFHRIVNNAWKQTFVPANNSTSALKLWGGIPAFDSKGNLWIAQGSDTYSTFKSYDLPTFYYLTPEKLSKTTIANSDFVGVSTPKLGSPAFKRLLFTVGKNDTKVACGGDYGDKMVFWDSNDDLTTAHSRVLGSFVDRDNVTFTWTYCYGLNCDNEGNVWLGCNQGVIYCDPTEAFNPDFRISRVKLTDANGNVTGTLLDGIQVNCIGIDSSNRKWIGTNTEGVTVLSADNKTVLKQFSTTNSALPSNAIYDIKFHPTRNSMFILTSDGIAECFIDVAPASENYDHTYVFPDPVRPDFTGWIEIKNLMSDSHVTIKNMQGDVVGETTANGGRAIWDGCDNEGRRLPTGIYIVFASPDSETAPVEVARVKIIK